MAKMGQARYVRKTIGLHYYTEDYCQKFELAKQTLMVNPLTFRRTQVSHFTEISILF